MEARITCPVCGDKLVAFSRDEASYSSLQCIKSTHEFETLISYYDGIIIDFERFKDLSTQVVINIYGENNKFYTDKTFFFTSDRFNRYLICELDYQITLNQNIFDFIKNIEIIR